MPQSSEEVADPRPRVRWSRWLVLLIALVVAVVAIVGAVLWVRGDKDESAVSVEQDSVALKVPEVVSTRCMVPSAESLSRLEDPFRGTLQTLEGDTATFLVEHHFDDATFDKVTLTAPDWALLDGGMRLSVGATYLITSSDGVVSVCGLSGEATPDLEALYAEAFSGEPATP